MNRKKTPRHQHIDTPAHLDTRKTFRIPTRKPELVCSNFNLRNNLNDFCLIEVRVPLRLPNGVVSTAVPHVQTSEQSPHSVSAPSTKHKQQARRTEVLTTHRGGTQLCVKTLQMTMTTTQAVKCRRLCDEKKIEKLTKKKLTGSSPRTHEVSALEASSSRSLTRITTCTSPYHIPPATLSWPQTRIGCWSSSAPPSLT